jgi:molybdenum cofactor cytidylyltransferase
MQRRDQQPPFAVGVILLAGGGSRRMGSPKLLLPWGTTTVLGHLIEQWKKLRARQIAVVTAFDAKALHNELDRLQFPDRDRIFNPQPDRGMFSSIQCAATWPGWNPELTCMAIALGDQPHLNLETLRALLEFGAVHPSKICQPLRNNRPRHPVLLPKATFLNLARSSATNLKACLEDPAAPRAGFESDDPGLDLDMDTPADYERAQASSGEKQPRHPRIRN